MTARGVEKALQQHQLALPVTIAPEHLVGRHDHGQNDEEHADVGPVDLPDPVQDAGRTDEPAPAVEDPRKGDRQRPARPGDEIQALKVGVMEMEDIFVANKLAPEGADKLRDEVEYVLCFNSPNGGEPANPIVMASALRSEGSKSWQAPLPCRTGAGERPQQPPSRTAGCAH
jgi:hypothetical protein